MVRHIKYLISTFCWYVSSNVLDVCYAQWGRVTHMCVSKIIIGSDNGCHLVGAKPFSEPMMEYSKLDRWKQTELSSAKCRLYSRGLNKSIFPTCDIVGRWPITSMCAGNHLHIIQGSSTFKWVSHSKSKYDAVRPYWNTNHMSNPLGCAIDYWNNHMQLQRLGI